MRSLTQTEPFKAELSQYINDLKTAKTQAHDNKKQKGALLKSSAGIEDKTAQKVRRMAFEQAEIKHLAAKAAFKAAQKVVAPYLVAPKKVENLVKKTAQPKAEKATSENTVEPKEAKRVKTKKTTKAVVAKKTPAKDDLKLVEGIGAKIEKLLHAAGIFTFAQLAETPLETMQATLDKAGNRFKMHNPATWREQAQLAADKKWDTLKALHEEIKAGVRV